LHHNLQEFFDISFVALFLQIEAVAELLNINKQKCAAILAAHLYKIYISFS